MFERFVLWLVNKFVSASKLTEHYVKTRFIKDPKGHIALLFHKAQSVGGLPPDFPSLPQVMLYHLHKKFTLSELVYLHALATIKSELYAYDPEYPNTKLAEFFTQASYIQESTNYLKVRKAMSELVQKYFPTLSEKDQESIASILQQHHGSAAAAIAFIQYEV